MSKIYVTRLSDSILASAEIEDTDTGGNLIVFTVDDQISQGQSLLGKPYEWWIARLGGKDEGVVDYSQVTT